MKQRKPFKTIDEQLDILRGRGLGIQDPDRCAAYILSNNSWHERYSPMRGTRACTSGTT